MTIHRSQPTSAAACMPGDFVRLVSARGACFPQAAQLSAAVVMLADGMFGKIANQNGAIVLQLDERIPALFRELGPMQLSESVTIERISVDQEHEKAIMGLQYLRHVSDVARQRAANADGQVQRGVMQALLGEAAGSDLRRIADELTAAGVHVVEKKTVRTFETNTVFLTTDPNAVREGRLSQDTMQFASLPAESTNDTIEVFDASRTRELLLSTQPVREVAPAPGDITPAVPPAHTNILNLLGLQGLTADDVALNPDFLVGDDNDPEPDDDAPSMR